MRELSLFSGAGGGLLASKYFLGWETIGYVEYEEYCQKVLKQRIADGLLDAAPIFGDIRKFISEGYAEAYKGMVDVITGGFPCQDISVCNRNAKGIKGERSGLWKSMYQCICIIRPQFAWVENSSALTVRGLGTVLTDLAQAGYDCRWICLRASDTRAVHHRDRIWIYAYPKGFYGKASQEAFRSRLRGIQTQPRGISSWKTEPDILRVDDGLAPNVDRRNKAIGNGQVPQCMARAWELLMEDLH